MPKEIAYPTPNGSHDSTHDGLGRSNSDGFGYLSGLKNEYYYYDSASQRTQQVFAAGNYINCTYDDIGQLKTAKGYGVSVRICRICRVSRDLQLIGRRRSGSVRTVSF